MKNKNSQVKYSSWRKKQSTVNGQDLFDQEISMFKTPKMLEVRMYKPQAHNKGHIYAID